ncbi:ERBB receptor feedback inhibitor 1a [Cynoglossus semilaevis]|uniref:ERBB receptor feedback inhibitor 1a n=1 Tax=Cynoglossus semilaevis TaxID=244447 RepID=A0A3P8X4C9_CYNSE|nr:ERBB receptor feedback inhibitor 1 [Cynoglossus semilaevis]
MRPECTWSMSTVGLTAQEISFPIENPFLRGSYCHSMAGSKSSWSPRPELNNFYFTMDSSHTDHRSPVHHQAPPPPSLSYDRHKHSPPTHKLPPKPSHLSTEASSPTPAEDDRVVPSFKKLSVHECSSVPTQTPARGSKPLPPIPPHKNLSPEQTVDIEVEFSMSSDESSCLVPDPCPKSSFFRYGPSRRSLRDCGWINYAYYDGPLGSESREQIHLQHQTHASLDEREQYEQQQQQQQQQQRRERPEPVVCQRQQDKAQRRLRRSHSGPAGSFNKPSLLRLTCAKRHTHSMDKPEVPPPIPPRVRTGDYRRWSAEVSSGPYSDEDKPPKVPPREPLSNGSSRTPSPKSLPTYVNGVMPPTQSFAPDPNYVTCRALHRQNSDCSPCIVPVMEDGQQVSNTHYYLMDTKNVPDWDNHTRRKVDLV